VPLAKLHPAEWNPRTIRDERFKNLCDSIQADPEFLWRRPILATADGTIYAGNMRYRAASHLGLKAVPAIVEDVPEQLAKERALRDNAQWGDWNDDQLAEMVYQMAASGSDVKLVGFDEEELAKLLGIVPDFQPVGEDEQGRLDQKATVSCPECGHVFTP
jgi:ParB-like chromosome segregation protein Spo0J